MDTGHWLIVVGIGVEATAGFFLSASAIKSQDALVRIYDVESQADHAEQENTQKNLTTRPCFLLPPIKQLYRS